MMQVTVVGRGEAGAILAADLRALGHEVAAYDVVFDDTTLDAVIPGADLVFCAVTPGQCVNAARETAGLLSAGAWYVDINSSSPEHKREASTVIDSAGGRYVEAALMSAIAPRRLGSPILLGGAHAEDFAAEAASYGLTDVTVVPGPLGTAAATKLCRSVLIKGMEALFTESLLTARHHGVERAVLDSLSNMLPDGDWDRLAGYFIERSLRHGPRRAEEMEEAAHTVAGADVVPLMAIATAERQRWAGALPIDVPDRLPATTALLDTILGTMTSPEEDA
jgi:3-hydroxyisobutyrate dehydrogenase-like beta-hydroxyacid dehydrogenase